MHARFPARMHRVAVYTDVVEADVAVGVRMLDAAGLAVRVLGSGDPARIRREARDAAALLVGYSPIDAATLAALPGLRIVATQSVGYEMVDLDAARAAGVWVTNVPDAATDEVAVHALAMSLSLLRCLPRLDRAVRAGRWDATEVPLRRPGATTLGILGLGRIGSRLAAMAAGVFGHVVGHDPAVPDERWPASVERLSRDDVLERADVLSLHLPLSAQTDGVLDAAALGRMRPGALLVNVARGGLIDEDAVLAALDGGRLGGAALDVLRDEPPAADHPLLHHPRTLVTPPAAYYSDEAAEAYVVGQAANVVAWARDGRPRDVVVEPGRPPSGRPGLARAATSGGSGSPAW
jgi:phosphoglycerate dehydrogenase-like enzyme